MKAAIVKEKGVLDVSNITDPVIGEYEVLCEMLYGATCTGTDQHIISDNFPFFPIPYPTILGHESVGRVIETGSKVRNFRIGDLISRVGAPPSADGSIQSHWGGYSQLGVARDHWAMCKDGVNLAEWDQYRINQVIPEGIDPREATMIITWRETLSYVLRMGLGKGSRVLILGSGGNGLSFVNHASNLGAEYIAMTGNRMREKEAKAVGTTHFYDYQDEDMTAKIRDDFPSGFDYIIDAVGKGGSMEQVAGLVKENGTLGIYGIDDYKKVSLSPIGVGKSFRFYNGGYDEEETHHRVITYIMQGKLKAEAWLDIDNPYPLDDIAKAFDYIRAKQGVKALIKL
jgi:D-arabinose 1-dehydrogenase-like Zn-dependent alcohol dehydrogenase